MTQGTNHERNDRIEATVMMAALATLGLLVALAVSTSVTAIESPELQATAPFAGSQAASDTPGIVTPDSQVQGSEMR
ncbi:hypothetical protein [Nioella aestuarii]|uniref:hypothetical protein n=1 Tax=Nioella aestuarii TaxID=1662864 RepID=UPI003D7F1E7D